MALKYDPNILPIWMLFLVFVVRYIALFLGENSVIASHAAVFAGEPMRAALPKYNVAGNDQLQRGFLCTEAFAGALGGFVGPTFCGVSGGAREEKRSEEMATWSREVEEGKGGMNVTGRHYCGC